MNEIIMFGVTVVLFVTIWIVTNKLNKSRRAKRERLRELDKRLAEFHKELDLLVALSKQLLPLKEDMDRLGASVAGRHAVVKISDWPKQYAFGIEKCAGFEIDWK